MGKYLILAFCGLLLSMPAYAQQTTGGLKQNKKQAIEALNAIRFEKVGTAMEEMSKAAKLENDKLQGKIDAQEEQINRLLNGENGNDGLINKINQLEALVKKFASCKPTTQAGCAMPATILDESSTGACAPGYINRAPMNFFAQEAACTGTCTIDQGMKLKTNYCSKPKSCDGGKVILFQGGGFGLPGTPFVANLNKTAHGGTYTTKCETKMNCTFMSTGTLHKTYSSCNYSCNDGKWTMGARTGEKVISECKSASMNIGPTIDLGF